MKAYIRSASSISAQHTFEGPGFLTEVVTHHTTRLKAVEPDYKAYIDARYIRRMSRVIKMGVAAAKSCLNSARLEAPGAIITGTAFGIMEDTVTFLTRIIELQEEMLPPTAFIQSTHNTVAAQIALLLKCHGYNNTFVHKGISFESALLDALMLLTEGETDTVLVGGIDEMIDTSFKVITRLGLYKRGPVTNLSLFPAASKGTVGGEGAAFFLLTNTADKDNLAVVNTPQTFYQPENTQVTVQHINRLLAANDLNADDIGLVITGKNGDIRNDAVYDEVIGSVFKHTAVANYKHLCGEYSTSAAFALWMAANIAKTGMVPLAARQTHNNTIPAHILIYNHYLNTYHSLMLVSAV